MPFRFLRTRLTSTSSASVARPSSSQEVMLPRNLPAQFIPLREGNVSGMVHSHWAKQFTDFPRLMRDLERDPGDVLRQGGGQGITSRRALVNMVLYVKMYQPDKLHRRLRDLLWEGRALREWRANCACESLGIHTAPVIAALTRREGLAHRHFFISAPAPGEDAATILKRLNLDTPARHELLRFLGGYVRSLHNLGFWHAHLHCNHIFLTPGRDVTLIDLERSMVRRPLPQAKVERNLHQMERSLSRHAPPGDYEEFMRGYGEE